MRNLQTKLLKSKNSRSLALCKRTVMSQVKVIVPVVFSMASVVRNVPVYAMDKHFHDFRYCSQTMTVII